MLTRDLFGVADFLLYFLVPHFLSHILTILQQLGLSLNHISYMISSHKLRGSSAEEYNKCSYSEAADLISCQFDSTGLSWVLLTPSDLDETVVIAY